MKLIFLILIVMLSCDFSWAKFVSGHLITHEVGGN